MNNFSFWQKWLTYSNIFAVVIGLVVAFAGNSLILKIHNNFTSQIYFEGGTIHGDMLLMKNWLFGVIGGTIVGFHLLMIMISENAFKEEEKWAYHALWIGMISWFLIDSSLSFYFGAWYNVLLINLPAFVMITLPLIMTRKVFFPTS